MRFVSAVVLMATIIWGSAIAAHSQSTAGNGPHASSPAPAAPAGNKPKPKAKTTPPPATAGKKYFVKVHSLASFCVGISQSPDALFPPEKTNQSACPEGRLLFPGTNAEGVVKALASDSDYSFNVVTFNQIAIYFKDTTKVPDRLAAIETAMDDLASPDVSYALAVKVPAGSAGRIAKGITPNSEFAVAAGDANTVLVLSKDVPNPVSLRTLSQGMADRYWGRASSPPTQRLFFLDANATAKKLSGSGDSSGDQGGDAAPDAKPKGGTKSSGGPAAGGAPAKAASADAGSDESGGGSTNGDASSDPAKGAGPSADPANADPGNADSVTAKAAKAKVSAESALKPPPPVPRPTMIPLNDMLVYSNSDGSDRGIFERNRLMAVLDLPRPEVLMNVWSLQASTRDPKTASREAEIAEELVAHHNQALEDAIEQGWSYLSRQMERHNPKTRQEDFFDQPFYDYVTQKFVQSSDLSRNDDQIGRRKRTEWGWCPPEQYCLGFTHAFEPLRPTLTNILLALIAARDSHTAASEMIKEMERPANGHAPPCEKNPDLNAKQDPDGCPTKLDNASLGEFHKCIDNQLTRLQTLRQQAAAQDCELLDRIDAIKQVRDDHPEPLKLSCFKQQTDQSFGDVSEQAEFADTRVGLLRAAVADFLFNYKWSIQYPHDFVPYDLTQSAQELNAEFNPLVLAFNRDVSAFTQNLQTELQCKHDANHSSRDPVSWFGRGDETFLNDGMIAVRGISGVESIVDTVTQSFFNATNPPSLTDLVKSVSDAEKNTPGVMKANLSANEAAVLLGALNSVQPAEAKIGRELKLDITPHALAGASSAELEVKLTAEEQGNPTRFTADKSTEDTLSRVAKHDTTTRVRVESLKLFEVSAFSAMLQRPRSKFPLLPPFFEVPYFGSFIGWPLPGAKVYHRSTAIISAIIVPTAADLAFGIDFAADRLCDASGCDRSQTPDDFAGLALRNYHKAIIQCFASGEGSAYQGRYFAENVNAVGAERGDPWCVSPSLSTVPPVDRRREAP
jgi:hypothetical protein